MLDPSTTGYSGTPLARKLGLEPGYRCVLRNYPEHYRDLFSDWPENVQLISDAEPGTVDFIHLFATEGNALAAEFTDLKPLLRKKGIFWISWPKASSPLTTDLKREPVGELGLTSGLVDVKVCAVDADWSALKFVYRKKDR